jgi:hypothetical protein
MTTDSGRQTADQASQQLWLYVGDPKDERVMIFEQARAK